MGIATHNAICHDAEMNRLDVRARLKPLTAGVISVDRSDWQDTANADFYEKNVFHSKFLFAKKCTDDQMEKYLFNLVK